MPAKRELSMRQLRHLLRLHHSGVSAREIARRLGVARTIQDNLKRAATAGLAWPLADDVSDEALERQLFGRGAAAPGQRRRVEPDWAALARELKRAGVTMTILWEEYREANPGGYGYSRFCDLLCARVRTAADPGDASAPRPRGEGVRRLFGQTDRDRRSDDGRDPRGGDFRRRARRLEAHLRRSDLDADVARLDRRSRAHVPLFRRRAQAAGAPQSEERGQQGLLLRPRDQPHLRRDGGALLGRNPAGAAAAAAGQGKSRGRRQIRPDLYSRSIARADVLASACRYSASTVRRTPARVSSRLPGNCNVFDCRRTSVMGWMWVETSPSATGASPPISSGCTGAIIAS